MTDATPGPTDEQVQRLLALAEELKEAGNNALKKGLSSEAEKLYSQGLEAALATKTGVPKILSQLYSNRAAVRLSRNALSEAVDDCRRAVECDSSNLKAYWRAAKASLGLDLYQQAVNFAQQGLRVDPTHEDLNALSALAATKLDSYRERRGMEKRGFTEDEAINAQNVAKQLADQLYLINQKIHTLEFDASRAGRTLTLLEQMPSDTPCFKGIGRGFIREDKAHVLQKLKSRVREIQERELPEVKVSRDTVEKRKMGADKELSEIAQSFKISK